MKINKDYIAIAVILLMFVLYLNVTMTSPIVFGDEGYYASQAEYITENNIIPLYETFKETDIFHPVLTKPPLFILTEAFFFQFGATAVKFMLPIFAMLTSFILYIFLKKTVNAEAGIFSVLLLMTTPSLITYGVLSYVDTLMILLLTCSLYFGYMAIESDNQRGAILSGIFAGLATLTKITAPIVFVILGLYFLFRKKRNWKIILTIILIAAILVSPWIIRNVVSFGGICYGPTDCKAITDIPIIHDESLQFAGKNTGGGTEGSVMSIGIMNYASFAFGWLLLFLSLFGISNAIVDKKKINIFMLIVMLSIFPIFFFYSSRAEDAARWTLPMVIGMASLAGIFLSKSYSWLKKKNIILAMIIIAIVIMGSWYIGQEKLNTMESVKAFSSGFFHACDWVKVNTPTDSLLLSIYAQQTAYNCNRRVSTAVPDLYEIMLTNDNTAYTRLKAHGYDYIFVMVGLITQEAYSESFSYDFYQYLATSDNYELVFDNTQVYGQSGVLIFKVN